MMGDMFYIIFLLILLGIIIFQYNEKRNTEKRLRDLTRQMDHFMQYPDIVLDESLEEGIIPNLQNGIKKLEELLAHQNAFYKDQEKKLNHFMENMAHQMKIAVTALQIRLDLAQIKKSEIEIQQELEMCQECLNRLTNEIERILRCSQLAAEKTKPDYQKIDMIELVEKCIQRMESLALKRDVEICFLYDEKKIKRPFYISVDIFWLSQAIENIIKNAIEHADYVTDISVEKKGKVIITVSDEIQYVSVLIEDTGEGILAEELPHLFERFYRGKSTKAGYGIGLSMAKDIAKMHHGDLTAGNRMKEGAWFLLKIPVLDGGKPYENVRSNVR